MKTEHTPGPWKVVPIGSQLYVESDGGFICDMQRDASPDDREGENIVANAKLIAQAPALLAENERLLQALRDIVQEPVGKTVADNAKVLATVIRIARAALKGGGL